MSRRALWPDAVPAQAANPGADGLAGQANAAAHTAPPSAPLPVRSVAGSAADAQVQHLARIADLHAQLAEAYCGLARDVEIQLAARQEPGLMSSVDEPTTPARLLTVEDLAVRLRVNARTIRRWRSAGKIPRGIELGDSVIRWPADQVERWLAEGGAA